MSKLLVSDYDGTFIRSDVSISKEQLNAVNNFISKGNIFAIITGRMTSSILPLVREIGLKGFVASFNGGEVTEIETGKHIYTNLIDNETTVEVLKVLEELGVYTHGYFEEDCFCQARTYYTDYYESLTGIKIRVLNKSLAEYFSANSLPTKKILAMDDPDVLDKAMPFLNRFCDKLNVIRSNAHQIEITDFASTKASALKFLAKYFNIDIANTYSVGDGGNDTSMIIEAGTGFAVANSEPILKEVAKVVLPYSNDQDAVRHIIEEYLDE